MKKNITFYSLIFILTFVFVKGIPDSIIDIQPAHADTNNSSIANIKLPGVKSYILDNGVRLYYVKDELPQINIVASVGFGKLYEDKGNAGISELIAKIISLSGSKKYPDIVLHQTIESIGARLSIFSSWEETVFSLRVMKRYADRAFNIIADLIENPNFNAQIIENAKSLLIENIRRKKDSPERLAFEKVKEIIFNGDGYGAVMTEETIRSISRNKIIKAWNKHFKSKNIIIGISSSLSFDTIRNYANDSFRKWEEGKENYYSSDHSGIAASISEKSKRVYLIHKDIPQATIVVGTIAPDIRDRGIFSLEIMNYVLGGGSFSSRLMKEIRVKRGLSYAVQSIIKFRRNIGIFLAYAHTKNKTIDLTFYLLLENIRKMKKELISNEELKWAKEAIMNSYIFEFDTLSNILSKYIFLSYNGLQNRFFLDYQKNINIVTLESVQRNSKELFKRDLVKVVVGKKDLKKELEKYGEVIIINP